MGGPTSRGGRGKKPEEIGDHILTARRRLHEALALGIKYGDKKVKKWQCSDTNAQLHTLKTMTAFISSVPSTLLQHPLIKDSISDIIIALEGTLQSENERISSLAADVTQKLISTLGSSVRQYPMLDIITSLSNLLSSCQLPVAVSCAISLNRILTHLGYLRGNMHKEVWHALAKADLVVSIAGILQNYVLKNESMEYFIVMASLLETILWSWPQSRFQIWSNSKFMASLGQKFEKMNTSIDIIIIKLYSVLALCCNGAMELLGKKELVSVVAQSMERSHSSNVRIEALRLCQQFTRSSSGCSMLNSSNCEPVVQGILDAMGGWRSACPKKVPADQMPFVLEACRAALLTRWPGNHQLFFWKHEIARVLLDILLGDYSVNYHAKVALSSDELVAVIYDNVANTRPFIWDILGNLSVYCEEDFIPKDKGKLCYLDFLISCACSVATDLMRKGCSSLSAYMPELEPVSRAVLLMVFSPCKYIAKQARDYLSEILRTFGDVCLEYVLASLKLSATGYVSLVCDSLHSVTNLISLAYYSTLPKYHKLIIERKGVNLLLSIIESCLNSDVRVSRSSNVSHLFISDRGSCCWNDMVDLEGDEVLLLYSLQALSQLIEFSNYICSHNKLSSGKIVACMTCENADAQDLLRNLEFILNNNFGPGPRWYASYILSFFGFYGFPSKLGRNMEKALNEDELADLELSLSNGQSLRVHAAVLAARCPYFLSHKYSLSGDEALVNELKDISLYERPLRQKIRISNRVEVSALMKILEYVYTGFVQIDDDLVKPLKVLARCCNLKSLSYMLNRKLPRWGSPPLTCKFTAALDPTGLQFSDIILEATSTGDVTWSCSICQNSTPHIHAHKVILSSSCDYLQALFHSGMHESRSKVVGVPVGWKALTKLVSWFYSGNLPNISSGCIWNNLDADQQFNELEPYVELSSLAEFWCLEEVQEQSSEVVVSCLKLDNKPSTKLISLAARLNQWKIVSAGVSSLATLYPKLRDAGELESLDEELVDMLRSEYVRCNFGSEASDYSSQ